jgi:DNA-binding NarL/FixJ family response regulator
VTGGVRVFIVDDHHLFRAGVRSELEDSVDIIGDASEVDAAIEMIRERQPDVVLLDVHIPGGGGRTVLESVASTHPEIRFLALSVSDSPEDVIAIVRAETLPAGSDPEFDQLSPREKEVLRLIALGHTYKETAMRLDIAAKTIERHVSSVLRKLQLSNRHELARWAADHRIV